MPAIPAFNDAFAPDFRAYLDHHGFEAAGIEPTPGLTSAAFKSDSFRLWLYLEHGDNVYAKVAPLELEPDAYYLGAVLAFLRGEPEPVLGRKELSGGLTQHHEDIKALMSTQAVEARAKLATWVADYARRKSEEMRIQAAVNRARKKWWQIWL